MACLTLQRQHSDPRYERKKVAKNNCRQFHSISLHIFSEMLITGDNLKGPKKYVKDMFCHVMAYACFSEMPQNRTVSVFSFFCSKSESL